MKTNFNIKGWISDFQIKEGETKEGNKWKSIEFTITEKTAAPNAVRLKLFGIGSDISFVNAFITNNAEGDCITVEFSSIVRKYENRRKGKISYFQENRVLRTYNDYC